MTVSTANEGKPKPKLPGFPGDGELEIMFASGPRLDSMDDFQGDNGEASSSAHRRRTKLDVSQCQEHQSGLDIVRAPSAEEESVSENTISTTGNHNRFRVFRYRCGAIVNNPRVQSCVIVLIILNALFMGIATFDFVTDDPETNDVFLRIDMGFLIVFTVELAMQIVYRGITLFQDGWLTFDFFIVLFSWAFESLQIIRAFRVFRVFRLITRVKPLRDLVLAIGAVLPRMYAIAALLVLIFYIFAVLFTELFKDLDLPENYFKTLDASLFTCFELMTLEWAGIVREVLIQRDWAWAPFLTFISLTGFIVFNLIVAVVCDAVAVVERKSKEEEEEEREEETLPDMESELCQAQERIYSLGENVSKMLKNQTEIKRMIDSIATELIKRKKVRPPDEFASLEGTQPIPMNGSR